MNSLDKLARRVGIEERFRNAKGEILETASETKRALLGAMGFKAHDDNETSSTLSFLDERAWRRSLPPVRVAYGQDQAISVQAVVRAGTSQARWSLELETGDHSAGTATCNASTCIESRDVDGRKLKRHLLALKSQIPTGYHRLRWEINDSVCSLIITPGKCWLPKQLKNAGACGAWPPNCICFAPPSIGALAILRICGSSWNSWMSSAGM